MIKAMGLLCRRVVGGVWSVLPMKTDEIGSTTIISTL
jgi:hypothetical protein